MNQRIYFTLCFLACNIRLPQETYTENLGLPKESKVVILHIDDIGMSHDPKAGNTKALEEGMGNSVGKMMSCAWMPKFMEYLKENPETDAGLPLALISEWDKYRSGLLAGHNTVPGLTGAQLAFWPSVVEVVQHANAPMRLRPRPRHKYNDPRTWVGSPSIWIHTWEHFLPIGGVERYIKVGSEERVPIMFPGGRNTYISTNSQAAMNKEMTTPIRKKIWDACFPVIDRLNPYSYVWNENFETG